MFHLYLISNFSLFLFLSVELNFVIIAVCLAKLANFKGSIMAFCSYGQLFLEKFKKQLRNGQRSSLKN